MGKSREWTQKVLRDGYIVTDDTLEMVKPEALSKAFKRLALKAELPPDAHLHEMRHSFATWLMESGLGPMAVAQAMGHSTPITTLKYYGHARPGRGSLVSAAITEKLKAGRNRAKKGQEGESGSRIAILVPNC